MLLWADSFETNGNLTTMGRSYDVLSIGNPTYIVPGRLGGSAFRARSPGSQFRTKPLREFGDGDACFFGFALRAQAPIASDVVTVLQGPTTAQLSWRIVPIPSRNRFRLSVRNQTRVLFHTEEYEYGQTYFFEVDCRIRQTNGTVGWYVNGQFEQRVTGVRTGTSDSWSWDRLGFDLRAASLSDFVEIDDLYICDAREAAQGVAGLLGDCVVSPSVPVEDGEASQWDALPGPAGTAHFEFVDDARLADVDDDAGYLRATISNRHEQFRFSADARTRAQIHGVLASADAHSESVSVPGLFCLTFNRIPINAGTSVLGTLYSRHFQRLASGPLGRAWAGKDLQSSLLGIVS